jgi:serine/threonine-protein kinase ATR
VFLDIDFIFVFCSHPKQTLWSLVAVLKSSQQQRQSNAKDIRNRAAQQADSCRNADARRAMDDFLGRLVEELIKVCNLAASVSGAQASKGPKVLSMSKHCRSLAGLGRLESVIVPLQGALTPAFPASGGSDSSHSPFAANPVTIHGFGDKIDVMSSLMCPVVVRIIGSDGKEYKFLCKPKDDLRKDSRMMDLNTMINRLLAKDVDARRRNLYIRTFSVIPLNENNGLIQWVNDTTVLRDILQVCRALHLFENPCLHVC